MKQKGFTLIEILLVVGAIAILAGIVILAINPTKQLADTRDAQRRSDIRTILDALYQYSIDNKGNFPVTIPTEETPICQNQTLAKNNLNPTLLMASVNSFNGSLTIRTACLPNETLANAGDVNPVRTELCAQTGTWNIMEMDGNKKLSGSGYGCKVENQLRNEGFGHRVCKAEPAPEPVVESVTPPQEEPLTLLTTPQEELVPPTEETNAEEQNQNSEAGGATPENTPTESVNTFMSLSTSENCVDLSFLAEDEKYIVTLPNDPTSSDEGTIGYSIYQSSNSRFTITAPHAEQDVLSITR